jgi:glycosyltransferase involved in cell wall biosynthesis
LEGTVPNVDLSVVVPTRNEEDNILVLLARVDAALAGISYELIVVDDSDDETPRVVESEAVAGRPVRLIHRHGRERAGGLSSAVVEGFRAARGIHLACLDADLQHPPEMVPKLLAALERADLVVASRYTSGGDGGGLDGPTRRLGSLIAKVLAQILVPNARLSSDPLGGFFALRRDAIEGIALRPVGFKILLEILARGHVRRVVDVPYAFRPRQSGRSKADFGQLRMYLRHLGRLCFGWG